MNTAALWPEPDTARARVLHVQTGLQNSATAHQGKRFADLFNLVADPATLRWPGNG